LVDESQESGSGRSYSTYSLGFVIRTEGEFPHLV
jgi:hypothetical protein